MAHPVSREQTPVILHTEPLARPWPGLDPFIFCGHVVENYPAGDGQLGIDPAVAEAGEGRWRMFHSEHVPGFPAHPHRGFETVTFVPQGLVDHTDSQGASARYGEGDVQWLTTGKGIEHAEMFPLLNTAGPNPLDLFQIWLNLPPAGKSAPPGYQIFWAESLPHYRRTDEQGRVADVEIVAGRFGPADAGESAVEAITPPPHSWAADPLNEVAIWRIRLDPGASITLPAASSLANRRLYFYGGTQATIAGQDVPADTLLTLNAGLPAEIRNADAAPLLALLLQGRPINQPVVAQGPFVLNTSAELMETMRSYQREGFGAWPWPTRSETHGDADRFAVYPDGRRETPPA